MKLTAKFGQRFCTSHWQQISQTLHRVCDQSHCLKSQKQSVFTIFDTLILLTYYYFDCPVKD